MLDKHIDIKGGYQAFFLFFKFDTFIRLESSNFHSGFHRDYIILVTITKVLILPSSMSEQLTRPPAL